jgi:site-specific recombinase XerD
MALTAWRVWEHYHHWLQAERQAAPRTIEAYRFVLWDWFAFLQPKPWNRATQKDLRRFLARTARTAGAGTPSRPLSANTRLHYAATVKAFSAWAYAAEHLRKDPMASFVLPKGGQPPARRFTGEQLEEIILTAALVDPRLHTMVALAYGAGLRCAEIAALRIEDVYLDGDDDDDWWLWVHGKGRKNREVPLHREVRRTILRLLAGRGWPRVGPVVTSHTQPSEPMTPGSVSRALSDHIHSCRDPRRPGKTINGSGHWLRHSFAVDALQEGGEDKLVTISRLLGHATTSVTERVYLAAYQGDAASVVRNLPYPRPRRPATKSKETP